MDIHCITGSHQMKISIIIPTYNEAGVIEQLLEYLFVNAASAHLIEIIVVDGKSEDSTAALAKKAGARVIASDKRNRAAQMNRGAEHAQGDILYFLHADSYPPPGFTSDIVNAVLAGNSSGSYRLSFDNNHWFLKLNCWFTRFDISAFRYGDQSLFITKTCFNAAGSYNEDYELMEDNEIAGRVRKECPDHIIIKKTITTSARRYLKNGIFRLQFIYYLIFLLYSLGFSQKQLMELYRRWIK